MRLLPMRLRTSLFLMAFGTALPLIAFALVAANPSSSRRTKACSMQRRRETAP